MSRRKTKKAANILKKQITGVFVMALSFFCLASFYFSNQSSLESPLGPIGQLISLIFSNLVGDGKFLLAILGLLWAFRLIFAKQIPFANAKNGGSILLFLVVIIFLHIDYATGLNWWDAIVQGFQGEGGGVLGAVFAVIISSAFGPIGLYIVLVTLAIIGLLMLASGVNQLYPRQIFRGAKVFFNYLRNQFVSFLFVAEEEVPNKKPRKKTNKKKEDFIIVDNMAILESQADLMEASLNDSQVILQAKQKNEREGRVPSDTENLGPIKKEIKPTITTNFSLPPFNLLKPALKLKNPRMNKDITDNVQVLEDTLLSFGVKGKVTQVSCGPAITRYELQPAQGVKVSRIVNLADDIALSLAAPQVRIEAPIPGKAAVGIEVPNKEISLVSFREVLETEEFLESESILTVAFGKDIAGKPVVADLTKMPHLLIAGATGSGKSVCMNALICSLLFKGRPDQLKILMIDPKRVELSNYNGVPHLVAPVVTEPKKAASALRWAVSEMERRYELFAAAGVRDITRYNKRREKLPSGEEVCLPFIVILVDELADLMMVAPADVEDSICRLAQMARAAGMHLVVATQRPSVDVITGLIKANIPSRVAFSVSSQTDSRTILDMGGAEKLLGRGDMLLFPVGLSKPIRVQGVFVSDKEVESIVTFLKSQALPEYSEEIINLNESMVQETEIEDELLPEAAKLVIEGGQASISMIQRRLRVGYNRAARLMDMLEARGVVGGFEGSKPRTILMGWDEFNRTFFNQ
ncbi:MAG: DNA translocase FtsK [Bacillota bacterium]